MSLETRLAAAMTAIGQAVRSLRLGKADDSAVVHRTGDETKTGTLTFGSAPVVPAPSAAAHPVRHDDTRLSNTRDPNAHAESHASGGTDALAPGDIGAAPTSHAHSAADVTDGTLAVARIPIGTTGQSVAVGNDARFPPSGGASGQVLTKASGTSHAMVWADPAGGGAGGTYITGDVPAGAATVTVTHNLGTRDVVVMVRDTATYQYVPVANDAPTINTVRLTFATAPTAGQYRYVVFAALGEPVQGPVAPTAHASTHAAGGADPVSPSSIGAAETGHTHAATDVSSGTFGLARIPTGTSSSTVALGNHTHAGVYAPASHTHAQYAATTHMHSADDVTAGTLSLSRLPTGTSSSTVALGNHTHSGYAATGHDHDAGDITSGTLAPDRVPPVLAGPWVQTGGFFGSGLAYIGNARDTGGRLTVSALGYDWMPMATAQYAVRSDIRDTMPSLELTVDGTTVVVGRGFGYGAGRDLGYRPVPVSPVLGVVLSGSSSHTFELWMRPAAGGGWTESSAEGNPHITVYALRMG